MEYSFAGGYPTSPVDWSSWDKPYPRSDRLPPLRGSHPFFGSQEYLARRESLLDKCLAADVAGPDVVDLAMNLVSIMQKEFPSVVQREFEPTDFESDVTTEVKQSLPTPTRSDLPTLHAEDSQVMDDRTEYPTPPSPRTHDRREASCGRCGLSLELIHGQVTCIPCYDAGYRPSRDHGILLAATAATGHTETEASAQDAAEDEESDSCMSGCEPHCHGNHRNWQQRQQGQQVAAGGDGAAALDGLPLLPAATYESPLSKGWSPLPPDQHDLVVDEGFRRQLDQELNVSEAQRLHPHPLALQPQQLYCQQGNVATSFDPSIATFSAEDAEAWLSRFRCDEQPAPVAPPAKKARYHQ